MSPCVRLEGGLAWIQVLASAVDCCQAIALAPLEVVAGVIVGVVPLLLTSWYPQSRLPVGWVKTLGPVGSVCQVP